MHDDPDLMPEWLDTDPLNSTQARQLEFLGVTRGASARGGGLGRARVKDIGGRVYAPDPAGIEMIIQPVWAGAAPSVFQAVETPVIFDLLAWHPDRPTQWWYRS